VEAALSRYRRARARSTALFDLLADRAYFCRPIALRHPVVFYDGHLPAFSLNTLVKRALGGPGIDPALERLFARGIDPREDAGAANGHGPDVRWPDRDAVRRFTARADACVMEALERIDADGPDPASPEGRRLSDAVHTILEHEVMHQETLLYMWHRLAFDLKRRPAGYGPARSNSAPVPAAEMLDVPAGKATIGVDADRVPFGWDNEHPACRMAVEAFSVDRHKVTNARYLEFVEAGGYDDRRWWNADDWEWLRRDDVRHPHFWERHDGAWYWRGMFDLVPLPLAWPVYVSHAEAAAFARWAARRLPTEAEFQRAAFGSPEGERPHPWGTSEPAPEFGVFDFDTWDPEPCGSHPAGASAWGAEDLVGNGWEWTSTPFAPLPGFRPSPLYPEYSADFFDGEHMVMKGASPATAGELLRPTFRNWFRRHYPYVYAGFRLVTS
jgi:ergothioneine biosynthesis protein EgtB